MYKYVFQANMFLSSIFLYFCWFQITHYTVWSLYQHFSSAAFCLPTLPKTHPNCYKLSRILASWIFCMLLSYISSPKSGSRGWKWVHIRIPLGHEPSGLYKPVSGLHSTNALSLAFLKMWPGNHSSQPWLSSLLAQKNIRMTSPPQPGPKSNSSEAEN